MAVPRGPSAALLPDTSAPFSVFGRYPIFPFPFFLLDFSLPGDFFPNRPIRTDHMARRLDGADHMGWKFILSLLNDLSFLLLFDSIARFLCDRAWPRPLRSVAASALVIHH